MGYKPTAKQYNLTFTDYPGLEVAATGVSFGELEEIQRLDINLREKDPKKRMEIFEYFEARLLSWNMEHPAIGKKKAIKRETDGANVCSACRLQEGEDMPPTAQSMLCLEAELVLAIVIGWVFAIARASIPKGMSLNSGEKSGPLNTPQELTDEIMRQLEKAQSLMPSSEPNFT